MVIAFTSLIITQQVLKFVQQEN